ncbi:unnamed protein product [Adineta steineri]|uniref:Uncharacterized protein n=1 Tax=Adineta steineri TaxID=433720 RepID=A0A813V228_9BILA|nr:unnamed protein product [Adineta steineri]CAF0871403.1 unnamed protein product [Adineta steineri]
MSTSLTNINEEVENLEPFYLIWFGNSINNDIQQQLRAIINYLLIFDDEEQCLNYIYSLSKGDRIILIVTEKFGEHFVPQIVHLRQIVSIYIYCNSKKNNEQWIKKYKKIKRVIIGRDELIQRIQTDYNQRQNHKLDETLSYEIFNTKNVDNKFLSTGMNDHFIHIQILIDCLINMESLSNDKNELMNLCKQQYKNNSYELNIIEEFEREYLSEKSLWWYTRHSFLYRLLNKAIRIQNIDLLLLFRFFIRDIRRQLNLSKSSNSIHVYRAQLMSKEEIELLTKFTGEFISINSFLSTNSNREQTRSSLMSFIPSDDIEKVIFEININHRVDDIKTFSNITSYSYFPGKEEILFMMGSIFRLIHIDRDRDGIWNIQLMLCANKKHQLQSFIQQKKHELDIIETDLLSVGFILEDMGNLDGAEKYYHRLLNQLSKDHEDTARCYHALGEISQKRGGYDSSIVWYNKALQYDTKTDDSNLALSYNSIGVVYTKKGDYSLALESYTKALELWKKVFHEDHPNIAMCYNNMGIIYQEEGKYSDALEFYHKAWNIREKYLSTEHSSLGQSHACIGNVHYQLKHYDLALEHYSSSYDILKKSLLPNHPDIAMILRNMGLVHRDKKNFQQALYYMKKAATMYRHLYPSTHHDLIQIEQIIQRISSKS